MKATVSVLALACVLFAPSAFAANFKVVCAGSSGYSAPDGTELAPNSADLAGNINMQLNDIAKTATIVSVSAPMTTVSTGAGGGGTQR